MKNKNLDVLKKCSMKEKIEVLNFSQVYKILFTFSLKTKQIQ